MKTLKILLLIVGIGGLACNKPIKAIEKATVYTTSVVLARLALIGFDLYNVYDQHRSTTTNLITGIITRGELNASGFRRMAEILTRTCVTLGAGSATLLAFDYYYFGNKITGKSITNSIAACFSASLVINLLNKVLCLIMMKK